MRRSVILSLCVLLVAAAGAQAATMFGTGDIADGNFTYTRTSVVVPLEGTLAGGSVTFDRIDVSYASAPTGAPGATLRQIDGTWAVSGGTLNAWGWDTDECWQYLRNQNAAINIQHGMSYVNFDLSSNDPYTFTYGNSFGCSHTYDNWVAGPKGGGYWVTNAYYYDSFDGAWWTDTEANKLVAGGTPSLLAQLWVTPGSQLSFNGTWDFGGTTLSGSVSTVPEPTTLALIGMGLVGLLCYAWRKRG
jgi:hypothetical protein